MYRQRLKRKAVLLVLMTGFLAFLLADEPHRVEKAESGEGERLVLTKGEKEEKTEPDETWTMPEANAAVRVLVLAEDGSIYHADRNLDKEYPGKLHFYEEEEGIVIVNEVPLEEYLCRVVPSEMPAGYSNEALKAQAVCARTYAVWQMQEYAYPEYKAHVDDSVSYQVYNNMEAHENTSQAVRQTEGQIMLYGEKPVKAYYFATSCGATTDENIWEKGDRRLTPYIAGRRVSDSGSSGDLREEEQFDRFIRKKHAGDLEIGEPWYRWNCYVPVSRIQENMKKWVKIRAAHSADGIMAKENEGYSWSDTADIGKITGAEIIERNTGGAVQQLLLKGEEGTLKIKYEYNIRLMLGIPGGEIHKNDGSVGEGGNLLPSGYFVLEPVEEKEELIGYRVYGGGLGHGAGMSQNGARILAEAGQSYEEILQYFYRDVRLVRLE